MSASSGIYSDRDDLDYSFAHTQNSNAITESGYSGSMLSIDMSSPLSGPARAERIKQMTKKHPAFDKSRLVQEVLFKVQTSLRRMPGVSAGESNEIIEQLQEVGQVVSQETSQLVDALMNITLDQEDTDKAVARMSIELNLAKAKADDTEQNLHSVREELTSEIVKREQTEEDMKRTVGELQGLSYEFKAFKKRSSSESSSCSSHNEQIKGLQEKIKYLEDQVNNRRSLWVLRHNEDPKSIAKVIENLVDSLKGKGILEKMEKDLPSTFRSTTNSDKHEVAFNAQQHLNDLTRNMGEFPAPPRAPSAFQHERPSTAAPRTFSPIQAGPPRAPSVHPQNRHFQGWNGGSQSRAVSMNNAMVPSSAFARAPSRRGGYPGQMRYRPNAPEFHPQSIFAEAPPTRPGTAFSNARSDYYGGSQASSTRSRYGGSRFQDQYEGSHASMNMNGALVPRSNHGGPGPLIHLTERSVMAWSKQVADFYSVIRKFVDNNASEPICEPNHNLDKTDLWPILIRTYSSLGEGEASSYIDFHIKDQNAKRCLVTRVVIDYVVNLVWVPGAWKGADEKTTYALADLEQNLIRTKGQPSSARQPLLDRQAAILDSIMRQLEHGSDFYKGKIEEIAGTLLTSLQPLLNHLTNPHEAYADLIAVAEHAWDLSSKILTSRLTFDFRFPEVGTRFSCQSMVPIWPGELDPMELQAKHWRVALVTTPVITCRNDTGTNISAHSVSLADVICMQ